MAIFKAKLADLADDHAYTSAKLISKLMRIGGVSRGFFGSGGSLTEELFPSCAGRFSGERSAGATSEFKKNVAPWDPLQILE